MWIWLNLEKVEFRTTFRPASEFGVHEVERFRNALKLLWHKANGVKDDISDLVWDFGIVSHAQREFRGILLHSSFNARKPQFKPKMNSDDAINFYSII